MWLPTASLQEYPANHPRNGKGRVPRGEDIFFTLALSKLRMAVAPLDVAMRFSVEEFYYATPLAIHKPWGIAY